MVSLYTAYGLPMVKIYTANSLPTLTLYPRSLSTHALFSLPTLPMLTLYPRSVSTHDHSVSLYPRSCPYENRSEQLHVHKMLSLLEPIFYCLKLSIYMNYHSPLYQLPMQLSKDCSSGNLKALC